MLDTLPKTLTFHPVTIADKETYLPLAEKRLDPDADRAFANLYLWRDTYTQEIAFFEGYALIRYHAAAGWRYLFPVGSGPLTPLLDALRRTEPYPVFSAVTAREAALLQALCPHELTLTETRDIADYLYDAASLATLSGKKLHGKRNHINAFTAAHDWQVRPLTPGDFAICRDILRAWGEEHPGTGAENERKAAERAFARFAELELEGALLSADGTPAAFTVGSILRPDTLCVHLEKALSDFEGAYPTINREFVRMMLEKHPALTTVNREDDMGLEGLRRAKLSYRPREILQKFTVTFGQNEKIDQ